MPLPVLLKGGGPRASGAGRRAKRLPNHVVLLCLRCADRHDAARGRRLSRPGRKTAVRCVEEARQGAAGGCNAAPDAPRLQGAPPGPGRPAGDQGAPALPCPGRGACIEDGTPVRLHCPWRGQLRDNSYNGRKKIHLHADGRRPLARRPRVWPRKGWGRRPCMAMPPPPPLVWTTARRRPPGTGRFLTARRRQRPAWPCRRRHLFGPVAAGPLEGAARSRRRRRQGGWLQRAH